LKKLDVLRAIHAGGFVRDLRVDDDFAAFLTALDQLESEGLLEGVRRYRDADERHVVSVRIDRLTDRGMSYVNVMSEEEE